ncbi:Hypothetical predicted protein [Lecanosticta acicola]|uniref:Rhodopsin domain-containing protein n=1 Tax=Lecanosticta acicola TaxID=111012 RepID=A0AAI8YSJ1_9PEZI|nr:Hypothetical predicted protein [Lecanosticta acicola]
MVAGGHVSGRTVTTTIITFNTIAGILTILRLQTRRLIVRNAGIDDVLVSLGLICSTVLTITMCEQVVYGMGRHEATLTQYDGIMSLRWFWASVWTYYLALWAVKMSILCQYLRIIPEGGFRRACYGLMAVVSAWTLWAFLSAPFPCNPVDAFWDPSVKGSCLNRLAVWFTNAAVNIVTDLATTLLPLPTLNSLQIPRRQKYILMVVFGMGGVTCLLSILRLQSLYVISKSTDISWDNPLAATWSSLEVNVGIICAVSVISYQHNPELTGQQCIPTLKGLMSRLFPTLTFGEVYNITPSEQRSAAQNEENRVSFRMLGYHLPEDAEKAVTVEAHELPAKTTRSATLRTSGPPTPVHQTRDPSPIKDSDEATKEPTSKFVGFNKSWEVTRQDCIRMPSPGFTAINQEAKEKVRWYVQRRPADSSSSSSKKAEKIPGRSSKFHERDKSLYAEEERAG